MKCRLLLFLSLFCSLLGCLTLTLDANAVDGATAQWSSYTYLSSFSQSSAAGSCGSMMGQPGAFISNANNGSVACTVSSITVFSDNIATSGGWAVSTNDYLEYVFTVYNTGDGNSSDGFFSDVRAVGNTIGLTVVDIDFQSLTPSTGLIKIIVKPNSNGTLGAYTTFSNVDFGLRNVDVFKAIRLTKWTINSTNVSVDNTGLINAILQTKSSVDEILTQLNWNNNLTHQQLDQLRAVVASNNSTVTAINNINNDQSQATQDAVDNSQTVATDSSQDAETQSQTLLQAFIGFVNAIKNASPTSCNINGNLSHGIDMGNLNFCANSPPSYITIIGSIIAIAFLVPLSYNTAKRLLSTIRSFQT